MVSCREGSVVRSPIARARVHAFGASVSRADAASGTAKTRVLRMTPAYSSAPCSRRAHGLYGWSSISTRAPRRGPRGRSTFDGMALRSFPASGHDETADECEDGISPRSDADALPTPRQMIRARQRKASRGLRESLRSCALVPERRGPADEPGLWLDVAWRGRRDAVAAPRIRPRRRSLEIPNARRWCRATRARRGFEAPPRSRWTSRSGALCSTRSREPAPSLAFASQPFLCGARASRIVCWAGTERRRD